MKKVTEHCDVCEVRIDYVDADGDQYTAGLRLVNLRETHDLGSTSGRVKTVEDKPALAVKMHRRTECGYSSSPTPTFSYVQVVCGPACLRKAMTEWLAEIEQAWGPEAA